MNVMKERRLRGAIPTQLEVAKAVGVKPSAVSKWERGLAKPRADKLPQLAKLYGCTIEELLADDVDEVEDSESRIGSSSLYCDRTCEYGKGQFA